MKHTSNSYVWKPIALVVVLIIQNNVVKAQDTVKVTVDTAMAAPPAAKPAIAHRVAPGRLWCVGYLAIGLPPV